jgi:hypothetical protein
MSARIGAPHRPMGAPSTFYPGSVKRKRADAAFAAGETVNNDNGRA